MLELHRGGASIADVANAAEVRVSSLKRWLARGRKGEGGALCREFAKDWDSPAATTAVCSSAELEALLQAEATGREKPLIARQKARIAAHKIALERERAEAQAAREAEPKPPTPYETLQEELEARRAARANGGAPSEGAARQREWEREQRESAERAGNYESKP